MEIKFVTLASDPDMVNQYIALRHEQDPSKPNERIRGDDRATFQLAVDDGGKVRMGMRLSTPDPDHQGWMPADKVPGATLEAMFPQHADIAQAMRENQPNRGVMYIDGIFSNISLLGMMGVMKSMLRAVVEHGREKGYAMVYALPPARNARSIGRDVERQGVKTLHFGPQLYNGHDGSQKGENRDLIVFLIDQNLEQYLRTPTPITTRGAGRHVG